jgi:dTDP-4-dehydrorhamnose reductase
MTRILLTGAGGMLGHDLVSVLGTHDVTALTRAELDITDRESVDAAVTGRDVVINAAAYTKVDDAESHRDEAFAINAEGTRNLARSARAQGATLMQLSTDYVFDGQASTPYPEDTPLNPVSVYGQSKAEGERAALAEHPDGTVIVRTAWLYGEHGPNFPATMLRLSQERDTISVVTDQIGQPTWTHDLAGWIASLIEANVHSGIFHGTNSGHTSWFDFARAVFAIAGLDPERIQPTTSESFVRPAPRPSWSVLGHENWSSVGLPHPRPWQEALPEAFPSCFSRWVS